MHLSSFQWFATTTIDQVSLPSDCICIDHRYLHSLGGNMEYSNVEFGYQATSLKEQARVYRLTRPCWFRQSWPIQTTYLPPHTYICKYEPFHKCILFERLYIRQTWPFRFTILLSFRLWLSLGVQFIAGTLEGHGNLLDIVYLWWNNTKQTYFRYFYCDKHKRVPHPHA